MFQNISKYLQYIFKNLLGSFVNYNMNEKWMNFIHVDGEGAAMMLMMMMAMMLAIFWACHL
jgi:hypothetical protein